MCSMEGQSVFKFAVKKVPECIDEVLNKAGKNIDDVELFVLHQANLRILTSISKRKKKLKREEYLDYCQKQLKIIGGVQSDTSER